MYPNTPGTHFDEAYYLNSHMKLVGERWGPLGMSGSTVLRGVAGGAPGAPATYRLMALVHFDSMDALTRALQAHGQELLGDIPNFTDANPVIQVGEALD